jgi:hypothetical protein
MIQCFVLEPGSNSADEIMVMEDGPCGTSSLHVARAYLPPEPYVPDHTCPNLSDESLPWPTTCDSCGYSFTEKALRSSGTAHSWVRKDTGEEFKCLRDAPPGALWRVPWYEAHDIHCGFDGQSWFCLTPGGTWHIDGRANNCTKPDDDTHRCWVRKGEAPNFTVGKDGPTCSAGAGSILCGSYHGFLRNGYLVPA